MAEQEEPESEPKADAIRGAAAIIRQFSQSRQKVEAQEAKKVHEMRMKDQMEPIGENEQVEWDGLRRRKTVVDPSSGSLHRRKTLHPPLGMAHFPAEDDDDDDDRPRSSDVYGSGGMNRGFFSSFRRQASSKFTTGRQNKSLSTGTPALHEPVSPSRDDIPPTAQVLGAMEMDHVYGLPPSLRGGDKSHLDASTEYTGASGGTIAWADGVAEPRASSRGSSLAPPAPPPHGGGAAKRQFSFTNVFNRHKQDPPPSSSSDNDAHRPSSRLGTGSRGSHKDHSIPSILKTATEEERLGLVKGDSRNALGLPEYTEGSDDDDWQLEGKPGGGGSDGDGRSGVPLIREESSSEDLGPPRIVEPGDEPPGYRGFRDDGGGGRGKGSGPAFI